MKSEAKPFIYRQAAIMGIMAIAVIYASWQSNRNKAIYQHDVREVILEQLPNITLKTLQGDTVTADDLLAMGKKAIVVHYWGTWCAPCEVEFPELVRMIKRFSTGEVLFVLLSVNEPVKPVIKFMKRFKNLPDYAMVLHDENGASMKQFGTVKVPETYVFGPDGKTLKKFIGPQQWQNNYYYNVISGYAGRSL